MKIEILGDGCARCKALRKKVEQAVEEMGIEAEISSVMDPERIAGYHAISLPQIVVDGTVVPPANAASLEGIRAALGDIGC